MFLTGKTPDVEQHGTVYISKPVEFFLHEHDLPSDIAESKKVRNVSYYRMPIYLISVATKSFAQAPCKRKSRSEGEMDSTRKKCLQIEIQAYYVVSTL